jgi:creatinine amidohydrolase
MQKFLLKDMTFREFQQRIPDNPVILPPLGSQEEHGPMAPMNDFMLTEAFAERADAIAAATLPFGYADYFRPIPGGIQLRAETFAFRAAKGSR